MSKTPSDKKKVKPAASGSSGQKLNSTASVSTFIP